MPKRNIDHYEYGFQLWRLWRKGKVFKTESMVLDARYFMLVVECEVEALDHGCGPDCIACWGNDERTPAKPS